jgi:glycerophosphoryl diester phosphodiesterase
MQVIGHRGAAALAPENTWESFDVALSVGVDAIETDVRATSDGVLILMHDERLERTTNGQGFVRTTPWSIIKTLDAGAWFGDAYRGAKVPLLQDTLEHYGKRTRLILEIKQPHIELWVLEMVRKLHLLDVVTFTSFYFSVVQNLKTCMPAATVGFLTSDLRHEKVRRVVAAGLNQFCPPARTISREQVSAWKELGLEIRVWGVKDPAVMMAALNAGVDGMTVDFPHLLLQVLGREK